MKTFSVKNFERFQHYKDRAPPWIKLYNELLDDYEFGALPDASKMHLIAIWLLASRSENKIPYDPVWVGRRINANSKVDLDYLVRAGFIVVNQVLHSAEHVASNALAECKQDACPETEGEERQSRGETEQIAASRAPKEPRRKAKTPLPDGFRMSSENELYAKDLGFNEYERKREHDKFCNHAKQNDRRCVNWNAAEHNWLTNAAEFAGKRSVSEADIVEDNMVEVIDQRALEAWDAYGRKTNGRPYPRDKKGGWRFPSKFPPDYGEAQLHGVEQLIAASRVQQ